MKAADFFLLCLQLALLLSLTLVAGELMRRVWQPAIVGEMAVGLILGPSVLGVIWPEAQQWLFRSSLSAAAVRDGALKLGMMFFLFRTGLEINFSEVRRIGGKAVSVGLAGTLVPIAVGLGLSYGLPGELWGQPKKENLLAFALFVGMALANSANPVIARILLDLGLLKSDVGRLIMTSTVIDDLVNWLLFALITAHLLPEAATLTAPSAARWFLSLAFVFISIFVIGRLISTRILRWFRQSLTVVHAHVGMLAIVVLLAGGITERLGMHAFLGAFLIGVAMGSEEEEREESQQAIKTFVLGVFVPVYFATMALGVDFARSFSPVLCLIVTAAAFAAKLLGVGLGARLAGLPLNKATWAVGFGLNARGATGIILAKVGFDQGIINERAFVALIVMCLVTSLASGPAMQAILGAKHSRAPSARD